MRFRFCLLLLGFFFAGAVLAQRDHFMYLQTADQQPFYIVYGGINYSSSSAGHLVLPKLADGVYSFQVGFPGKLKTTRFDVQISGKDEGFIIEPQGDNIQLKNLVKGNVVASYVEPQSTNATKEVVAAPLPTETLVEDSTKMNVQQAEEIRVEESKSFVAETKKEPVVEKEPLILDKKTMTLEEKLKALEAEEAKMMAELNKGQTSSNTKTVANSEATVSVSDMSPERNPVVTATIAPDAKKQENKPELKQEIKTEPTTVKKSSASNTSRTFLDMEMGIDSSENVSAKKQETVIQETKQDTAMSISASTMAAEEKAQQPKVEVANVSKEAGTAGIQAAEEVAKTEAFVRKPCGTLLSKDDAATLQEALATTDDEDDFIYQCRKAFKQNCVTTYQIRDISKLLKTDAMRYRLLDAAWPYTADYFNYRELRSMLKDEYYISRFDAMIK